MANNWGKNAVCNVLAVTVLSTVTSRLAVIIMLWIFRSFKLDLLSLLLVLYCHAQTHGCQVFHVLSVHSHPHLGDSVAHSRLNDLGPFSLKKS